MTTGFASTVMVRKSIRGAGWTASRAMLLIPRLELRVIGDSDDGEFASALVDSEDHGAAVRHVGKRTQGLRHLGAATRGALDLDRCAVAASRSHPFKGLCEVIRRLQHDVMTTTHTVNLEV